MDHQQLNNTMYTNGVGDHEWLLINANSAIFSAINHDENKLIFNDIMKRSALY